MKESERQRKLQEELEKARKLELRARQKLPEPEFSPEDEYKAILTSQTVQVLRKTHHKSTHVKQPEVYRG